MTDETISAIELSKTLWVSHFTRVDSILVLCALVVQITLFILALTNKRHAISRTAARSWQIGALLTAINCVICVTLIWALVMKNPSVLRGSLLAFGFMFLVVCVIWTRLAIHLEAAFVQLSHRLADSQRALHEHQTQLDGIVARRTRVLFSEVSQRRKAQQALTKTMERSAAELEFASNLQRALLVPAPQMAFAEIHVNYQAASEVSGDTYSFVHDKTAVRVVLADAMGHGVPAALLTQLVLATSLSQPLESSATDLFHRLNRMLDNGKQHTYVTASWLKLEQNGHLEFCGAGNAPLLIFRKNSGELETLDGSGQPLGMFDDILIDHTLQSTRLMAGDRVLLLTDGLLEWTNADKQMFGIDGIAKAMRACSDEQLGYAIAGLQNAAWEFSGMRNCTDDVTVIGLEFRGC